MKKTISMILTAAMCISPFTAFASDFESEIKSYPWARTSVEYCFENGILQGDEFGNFDLGGNLTRAQMARIFTDAFGLKQAKKSEFADSKVTDWYYPYSLSIQDSMPKKEENFNGGEYVTRAEFAATLAKAAGEKAANSNVVTRVSFKDYEEVDEDYMYWLETAIKKLYMLGDEGYIRPNDLLTRAEACAFLYRVVNPGADKTPIMGESQVTLKQAQAWAKAKGAEERYIDIAPAYWYYGELFGIRPEVMYAQAAKETGYGRYTGAVLPEMNNWAGIKIKNPVEEKAEDHETFETPEDGVRAHYNHMCAYVGVEPIGEVHDRYYVVKTNDWAGTVKYVEELGGKWFAGIYYGYQILDLVENMKKY